MDDERRRCLSEYVFTVPWWRAFQSRRDERECPAFQSGRAPIASVGQRKSIVRRKWDPVGKSSVSSTAPQGLTRQKVTPGSRFRLSASLTHLSGQSTFAWPSEWNNISQTPLATIWHCND